MIKEKELSDRFVTLLNKLNAASDKKQMSVLYDHPWHSPIEGVWLKKRENLSIYNTRYYDLATEEERQRLSVMETATWWNTFIAFENLVSEYYLKIINHESLKAFPEVIKYMHHFCREEVTHALVFKKALNHFNIPPFPLPENLKDFYKDNASIVEFPLKAIYLTIVIEWFAENNAMLDCNNDFVSPLSRAIAVEHHKEEARHIEWGKLMMREFIEIVPNFLEEAQEYTAPFMRNLLDMATCNPETYNRVGFSHPDFQNHEELFETVLFSNRRKEINRIIMEPLIRFFIELGIYNPDLHEIWEASGFGDDVLYVIEKLNENIEINDNLLKKQNYGKRK